MEGASDTPVVITVSHADLRESTEDIIYRLCFCGDCVNFWQMHHDGSGLRDATGRDTSLDARQLGVWRRRLARLGPVSEWTFETPQTETPICLFPYPG